MAIGTLVIIAAMAALLIGSAGAQGAVCAAPQVANYSGAELVGVVGSIGWITSYYTFTGFASAQIVYPNVINYTRNSAPGSSYLISADYRFSGPANLTANPTVVFVLVNNTQQGCAGMKLFAYNEVVAPYSPANLITPQQATSAAQEAGYNVTFGPPLTLVPASNQSGIQTFTPGYASSNANYTVYADAENGTVFSEGNAHIAQGPAASTPSASSILSEVYSFFLGIYNWLKGL